MVTQKPVPAKSEGPAAGSALILSLHADLTHTKELLGDIEYVMQV